LISPGDHHKKHFALNRLVNDKDKKIMSDNWNFKDAPVQTGKIAIVTGANAGLGFETAKALAQKGAKVIMACRSMKKANAAQREILLENPGLLLESMELDLADFDSVRKFASEFSEKYDQLDLLINNAGVMMPPFSKTKDDFELQFQVNYLSHFLLTSLLLDKLEKVGNARVISLSSIAHKRGDIYFDDYNFEEKYDRQKSYGQSKLACLMFAYELQRRLQRKGSSVISIAAHPGVSNTELARHLPKWMKVLMPVFIPLFAQGAAKGALPQIRASIDPTLQGGEYIGPNGSGERKGKPVQVDSSDTSKDQKKAEKLWELSEKLTETKVFEGVKV
jgi:NAD(P)-dependent dehydrogenase (short-subunit alcohol dehydrogenase family)